MKVSSGSSARTIAFGVLALCLFSTSEARAALIHDYEFNNSLADSLGGPSLVPLGNGGTVGPTSYSFAAQQGLSLSNGLTTAGTYTVDLSFAFDSLNGYRKILDFKNLASDNGLYNLSTALDYYLGGPINGPSGAFAAGTYLRVDLTRDNTTGLVVGYVNGVSQLSFTDSTSDATFTAANKIINFFQDDAVTGGGESSSGSVNQIRIWDNALNANQIALLGGPKGVSSVPEPSSLALAAAGLAFVGLGVRRARRRADRRPAR